jgi:transposase-like protein
VGGSEEKNRDNRKANVKAIKCPHCGSELFHRNGSYKTTKRKRVSRFTCRKCEKPWEVPPKPTGALSDLGFYDSDEVILQSIALVAVGLPLEQVAGLVELKAETVGARLLECYRAEDIWNDLEERLISTYRVSPPEIIGLNHVLADILRHRATFHALARRKVTREIRSQRQPLRARRREERASKEGFKRLRQQRGLSPEEIELEWQGCLRMSRNTFELPSASLKKLRNKLKRRVERILSCKIVVTDRGGFYRLRNDRRVIHWFKTVRQFEAAKHERLLKLLSPSERWLLGRINCSPATAAALGRIEREQGGPITNRPEQKLTLDKLAKPRYAERLIDDLESLAKVLRPAG